MYDLFFISYDEPHANENYEKLVGRYSFAKRIHGIEGIVEAHKEAAIQSLTEYFWVVDGDNEIRDSFSLSFYWPRPRDLIPRVGIWNSINAVNGLEYGNGGIKLLPRRLVLSYDEGIFEKALDFTMSLDSQSYYYGGVASVNRFNTSQFHSWRAAFREVMKLKIKMKEVPEPENSTIREWIQAWLSKGAEQPYGIDAIRGANDAIEFYNLNPVHLSVINDFEFLKDYWKKKYGV